mmetsp:Transcript_39923/g.104891  ORF Transcript_39923/g.104891 Transcript_39923/m.104891 type:complete len:219 (+) Transcript_39923:1588-2244(+)
MRHVGNIESPGGHICCHEDACSPSTKLCQRVLPLILRSIPVDGGSWQTLRRKRMLKDVGSTLCLDEDERETFNLLELGHESLLLLRLWYIFGSLCNQINCRSNSAYSDEYIVVAEITSKALNLGGECRREHERLAFKWLWHTKLLSDATYLWLKPHVEHPIGLIKDENTHSLHNHPCTIQQINEPARSTNQQFTTALELPQLLDDWCTSITNHGSDAR